MAVRETIEVLWKHSGTVRGSDGCWIARIKSQPKIWDAGQTTQEAIEKLLVSAPTFGLPGHFAAYNVSAIRSEP